MCQPPETKTKKKHAEPKRTLILIFWNASTEIRQTNELWTNNVHNELILGQEHLFASKYFMLTAASRW